MTKLACIEHRRACQCRSFTSSRGKGGGAGRRGRRYGAMERDKGDAIVSPEALPLRGDARSRREDFMLWQSHPSRCRFRVTTVAVNEQPLDLLHGRPRVDALERVLTPGYESINDEYTAQRIQNRPDSSYQPILKPASGHQTSGSQRLLCSYPMSRLPSRGRSLLLVPT